MCNGRRGTIPREKVKCASERRGEGSRRFKVAIGASLTIFHEVHEVGVGV